MVSVSRAAVVATLALAMPASARVAQRAEAIVSGPVGAEQCVGSNGERCTVAPGVTYRRIVRAGPAPLVMHVAEVDLTAPGVRVAMTPADRSAGMEYRATPVSAYVARSGAVLAVNASYFLPFVGGSPAGENFVPQPGAAADASGAVLAGGEYVSKADEVDARVDSMVCFTAGRAVIVEGQACPAGFTEGVSAGPRLLNAGAEVPRRPLGRDGVFHGAVKLEGAAAAAAQAAPPPPGRGGGPRTALGLNDAGTKLWLVVADGRQPGYSEGATNADLLALFREVGATQAMSLDGGGSATMVAKGPSGPIVLSRPIHTGVPGRERPVGNHLGVFVDGLPATPRFGALLPPKLERPVAQLEAVLERIYGAPEARQGVAVDATHFYALVNTAIGKYERDSGRLVARWAGPRGGLIRHLNSCTVVAAQLVCAHSNHPEVPHGSSVEIFDTATLAHTGSVSLGNRDEGSLTIVEPIADGWLLGFAHYSDETGVPFKGHDYSQLISTDAEWRRREGWLIPPAIRKRMAPQAASGGAIGNDGLLYLFGHTLPEMYVLARPKTGAELIHLATIKVAVEGQAFAFDPTDARRIFAIDRPSGTVRVFKLPVIGGLPDDARLFERRRPAAEKVKPGAR
ncbi:MAG: hypothetical protein C0500_04540 [Sphingobium sp.]|nr:hypothetical protein [Sphingobium sp.]